MTEQIDYKNRILDCFKLFIIIFAIFTLVFFSSGLKRDNAVVILSFVLNTIFVLFGITSDNQKYSLNKTFWYFNLFFMCIAPLFQYLSGYNPWGHELEDVTYIGVNILLFTSFLIYTVIRYYLNKKALKKDAKQDADKKEDKNTIKYREDKLLVLLGLSVVSLLALSMMIGFKSLFVRGENSIDISVGSVSTILNILLRSIPVYSLAYSINYNKSHKKYYAISIILLGIVFIANFPVSLSRYILGIVYLGIFILLFDKFINRKKFDYILLITFIVIFPIMQLFKWYNLEQIFAEPQMLLTRLSTAFNSGDFDAFSMIGRSFEYVTDNYLRFGQQLLITICFFVPRSIWPTKPVPTGQLIAESQGQEFTNLSCPIYAEGYIDFGLFGVVLYVILAALIIHHLDKKYWNNKSINNTFSMCYPFAFGAAIFLLRGSLQPTFIFTFAFFIFYFILKYLSKQELFKK